MKFLRHAAVFALGVILPCRAAADSVLDTLSAAERARLDAGQSIVKTREIAGSSFPAVTVVQLVNTTPEAAMAIFTDYDEHASYLKECCGVLVSRVVDRAVSGDLRVQRVLYELSVPLVSNERYELREEMSKGDDGSYRVVWGKASSGGHSEAIFGRAVFEPYAGKTLFSYYNFTRISSFGAGLVAGASVDRAQRSVGAIARHMEQESSQGGARFQADLARVRAALGR